MNGLRKAPEMGGDEGCHELLIGSALNDSIAQVEPFVKGFGAEKVMKNRKIDHLNPRTGQVWRRPGTAGRTICPRADRRDAWPAAGSRKPTGMTSRFQLTKPTRQE